MTLFRIALRSHLGGFVANSAIGVIAVLAIAIGYGEIAGSDPASRSLFAQQMQVMGRQLSYMLPPPAELETLAGFLQWRHFGALAIPYAFWALIAASGAGRGDEERGLVELWLSAGVRRWQYLVTRLAGFGIAAAASVVLMTAAALLASAIGGEELDAGDLASQGVALVSLSLCCFALALAVAQVPTTRADAAGLAGIVVFFLYLVNAFGRTAGSGAVQMLSPFWAYDRSAPLLRTGTLDVPATLGLLVATGLLTGAAVAAFTLRDLGGPLVRRRGSGRSTSTPSRDPLLRLPVLAALVQQRTWTLEWAAGVAVISGFMVSLTRTTVDTLLEIPAMRVYFERLGAGGYDSFVGVIWGSVALLLLALFAIFQVRSWVADDAEGRLESVLAQPVSRARVALERLASFFVGTSIVVSVAAATVWLTASRQSIDLSAERFVPASALMVTVPFAFAAIGAALAASRPRLAVPVLTAVAVVGYLTQQFAPLFGWPEWVERTSIFSLYGTPMSTGVEWGGIATLIAVGVVGTVLSVIALRRRDVGR